MSQQNSYDPPLCASAKVEAIQMCSELCPKWVICSKLVLCTSARCYAVGWGCATRSCYGPGCWCYATALGAMPQPVLCPRLLLVPNAHFLATLLISVISRIKHEEERKENCRQRKVIILPWDIHRHESKGWLHWTSNRANKVFCNILTLVRTISA